MERYMRNSDEERNSKRSVWLENARTFFNSCYFYAFLFLAGAYFSFFRLEPQGALLFVGLISLILVVCDDILATTFPFLLVSAFVTDCYDSYDTFIVYVRYLPIVLACLLFHFVVYGKSYSFGESFKGIFAVALAICLGGGFGRYSLSEYFHGAYYVLGLSVGMMATYALMKSQFSVRRAYDAKERFAVIMLLLGLFCGVLIACGRYNRTKAPLILAFSPNNLATLLMFAMPFPLYLARKHAWCAIFTPIILIELWFCESRGGMLFGSVEFLACTAYWIFSGNKKRRAVAAVLVFVIGALIFLAFKDELLQKLYVIMGIKTLPTEARAVMLRQAVEKFKSSPVLGTGILDAEIQYNGKKGTMAWYHMMIPQIIGSMGLIGVATYGFQAFGRIKLIFTKKDAWSLCLGLSYLGILLMSQVNPGEFCPVPFELLTVLLFIFQEERFVRQPLWNRVGTAQNAVFSKTFDGETL